jgi:pseudouridine synthase
MNAAAAPVRLASAVARSGLCSRREAESMMERGFLRLVTSALHSHEGAQNHSHRVEEFAPLAPGTKVGAGERFEVSQKGAAWLDQRRFAVLLNKPRNVLSVRHGGEDFQRQATDVIVATGSGATAVGDTVRLWEEQELPREEAQFENSGNSGLEAQRRALGLAVDFARAGELAVCGRLDARSRGLLVLTPDGRLARGLVGEDPSVRVEKEYTVRLHRRVSDGEVKRLNGRGFSLKGHKLRRMVVTRHADGPNTLSFVLTEGRKHQIRLVCQRLNLEVRDLFRIRVGPWTVGGIPEGSWTVVPSSSFLA